MKTRLADWDGAIVPRRQRHYSYDETVNESGKLIADEPVEVEEETPAENNEPIEEAERDSPAAPPVFEE